MLLRRARVALLAIVVSLTTVISAAPASAAETFKCGTSGDNKLRVCIDYEYFDGGAAGVGWSFYGYAFSPTKAKIGPNTFKIIYDGETKVQKLATIQNGNIVQLYWKHKTNGRACAGWIFSMYGNVHGCIND